MAGAPRSPRASRALWVGVCLAAAPAALGQAGSQGCRLEIKIEGHPEASKLDEKIRQDAQRVGACTRSWSLRVSPGPGNQFVLALWNGSDLETRWARNAREVEAVAEMLLRTAVEHDPSLASSAPPLASSLAPAVSVASSAPPAATSASPPPPPASASASALAPALAPAPLRPPPSSPGELRVGPTLGGSVKLAIGPSAEVGLLAAYGGAFRFGLWPTLGGAWGQSARRWDVQIPLVFGYAAPVSASVSVGGGVGVGAEGTWARGSVAGATAVNDGMGLLLLAWPEARVRLSSGFEVLLALPVRYSTTTDDPVVLSTQTIKQSPANPPNSKGVGPKDKVVTTTTYAPSVADRMGGWSMGLSVGLLR